jgi:hypothetical protein
MAWDRRIAGRRQAAAMLSAWTADPTAFIMGRLVAQLSDCEGS